MEPGGVVAEGAAKMDRLGATLVPRAEVGRGLAGRKEEDTREGRCLLPSRRCSVSVCVWWEGCDGYGLGGGLDRAG